MRTIRTAAVRTAALSGLDAVPTIIEARIETGAATGVQVEGEPAASALETATRVERAITAVGWDPRRARAVVRTNPAVPTSTQLHDLPAALAILVAAGKLDADAVEGRVVVGALKWGPAVEPIAGTLAVAELCRKHDWPLVVPAANGREAAAPGDVRILPASDLGQIVEALRTNLAPAATGPVEAAEAKWQRDLAEITGRETAKRALEIAAAGGHPLLLAGPPAAPTTGLALRMTGILPEMSTRGTADRDEDPLDSRTAAAVGGRPRRAAALGPALQRVHRGAARSAEQDPGSASYRKSAAGLGNPCALRRALPGRHRPVPHQRPGRVGKGGRVEADRRQPRRDARGLPAGGHHHLATRSGRLERYRPQLPRRTAPATRSPADVQYIPGRGRCRSDPAVDNDRPHDGGKLGRGRRTGP